MSTVRLTLAALCILAYATAAAAQDPFNVAVRVDQLANIFADLYGPDGLVVDSTAALAGGQSHSGHFNGGFESEFTQFGIALTSQLVSVPLPTPAAGFTFQFDPALGVFTRTTNSFGPILSERAETIGRHRMALGVASQRLQFDTIEGLDLKSIPAVFTHDSAELLGGREDVITTTNSIEATVMRTTAYVSYGVTNRLDVSVAVPVVSTDLVVTSDATIRRLGTTVDEIHFFRALDGSVGNRRIFTAFGKATGVGDVTLRGKLTVKHSATQGMALGVNVKMPTGDETNLLGTGATAVQPFGVWSGTVGPFSPHVNAGYQWNGSSTLAGGSNIGQAKDLPDVATYSAGGALEVHPRFTLAIDILGRSVINGSRLSRQTFHALDGRTQLPDIRFRQGTLHELSAATGFKLNIGNRLLVNGNLLFRLNSDGLSDKVSPLLGIEYAF